MTTKIKASLVSLTKITKPVWLLSHKNSKQRQPYVFLRVVSAK